MGQQTYLVTGMTCEHCVASIIEEVRETAGVTEVKVDLANGKLLVTGSGVSDSAVLQAVETAGYSAVRS